MKNLMFKLGAIMLIVAMLLCCFVACGEEGEENGEDAEVKAETKSYQIGGVTLNYPVNLKIMTETADMVMLMDAMTGQSVNVIKTSEKYDSVEDYEEFNEPTTAEEFNATIDDIKNEAVNSMGYRDVKVELISISDGRLPSFKMEFIRDGIKGDQYGTAYTLMSWDAGSLTLTTLIITVVDTTADRPIANGLIK